MSQQALSLRRSARIVRRHSAILGIAIALGVLAGAVFSALHPPLLASRAVVVLPPNTRDIATQVVVAGSDPVLAGALQSARLGVPLTTLRHQVQVKSLTSNVLAINTLGQTAAQAEDIANAVASSYIAYLTSPGSAVVVVHARVLDPATPATGTPLVVRLLVAGLAGAVLGGLVGVVVALAVSRGDRRLRERDQIADAIGVPVLASVPAGHPSDAAGWARLLESYEPEAVYAWKLRKALDDLGLTDPGAGGVSLAVLSFSSDPGALALGPQLAVFAASLGIATALVIGPEQGDASPRTAMLRAACAVTAEVPRGRSGHLRVVAGGAGDADRRSAAALTVVVAVVDGRAPRVADTARAEVTVLGVSAGAVTAEQLALVAVSAADDGRDIAGLIVADPDPADQTTGRLPQRVRRRPPGRAPGSTTETSR